MPGSQDDRDVTAAIPRAAGRVLLLDGQQRVLLIHERIGDSLTHWLTPGGGIETGEEPWQAAAREVWEETGIEISLGSHSPEVLTTRRLWSWRQLTYDQVDHFFLATVPSSTPITPKSLTDVEKKTLIGHAWWSRRQLRSTAEVIVPGELANVLDRIISERQ